MKIREEPFNDNDEELLRKVYSKHISSYWLGQITVIFMSIIGPYIPRKYSEAPSNYEEYKYEVAISLLIMTALLIFYFYKYKYNLREDKKMMVKELVLFEVLKKERLYEEKAFYVFIENHRKEEVSKELYNSLSIGDQVMYYQSKFSKERLSETFRNE